MEYKHVLSLNEHPEFSGLNDLRDPPKSLYIYGNFEPTLFDDCVAVVGSRKITTYGRQVIEKLVPQLVLEGKTIVSGFMYGVDQYAHQMCVDNGGKTIAVLGWGITRPLEGYDKKLADLIVNSGGLLISEWKDQIGTLWTFPVRNRIVAALSKELYVIEAAKKSGSLLTVELAKKLNRIVWAIPGPVTSKTSEGTNWLINEGKAHMWTPEHKNTITHNDPILNLLTREPLTINEIAIQLKQPVASVGACLSMFMLMGTVIEREGKYYYAD